MPTSDSSKLPILKEFFSARGIDFISNIEPGRTPQIDFIVSVSGDRIAELAGRGQISHRQMVLLQTLVKKHTGFNIEWVVTPSERSNSIEGALLELIELKHPRSVSGIFISAFNKSPVSVWIERHSENTKPPELNDLQVLIEQFLMLYGIRDPFVTDGVGANLPSTPVILRRIKVHAPITTDALAQILQSEGLSLPDSRWLQRNLDRLRKQALLSRSKAGKYCLTEKALGVVPRSRNRTSSDVERALALGRRKW